MELRRRAQRHLLEDKTGITTSGPSAKRPKTTARALPGVPAIHSLPPELLETIFGFLGAETLCTARLVCTQFRLSASRCIHAVEISVETLSSRPETTLNNFPNLSRVTVFDFYEIDLLMLALSPVADAVTHLWAEGFLMPVRRHTRNTPDLPLLPFPKLTSLTVAYAKAPAFLFPQTLRELSLGTWALTDQNAHIVAGLTNLTCLGVDIHMMRQPFEAVTALTALQMLEIRSELSFVPYVAELTLLSHLDLRVQWTAASLSYSAPLASLARLHRLVHLKVDFFGVGRSNAQVLASLEHEVLASISTFSSLRSLGLELCRRPDRSAFETVCMTPFSQLTALRLTADGLDASFLPRFSLERLQDLSLSDGVQLDGDGVAAMRRATGLTHLQLWTTTVGASVGPEEVDITLSRMSRLRALSLLTPSEYQVSYCGPPAAAHATFSLKAIALLTELTALELSGREFTTNADMEVCLGLKKLRVLRVEVPCFTPAPSDCITPETFFAIAKLPELRKFDVLGDVGISEGDLTEHVRARLNVERHAKGWPALELKVYVPRRSH